MSPVPAIVRSDSSGISFYGLWGSGASDVWAVGDGTIVHWDGSAWTTSGTWWWQVLFGIWGSGASDVWAVGAGGTILERRP